MIFRSFACKLTLDSLTNLGSFSFNYKRLSMIAKLRSETPQEKQVLYTFHSMQS